MRFLICLRDKPEKKELMKLCHRNDHMNLKYHFMKSHGIISSAGSFFNLYWVFVKNIGFSLLLYLQRKKRRKLFFSPFSHCFICLVYSRNRCISLNNYPMKGGFTRCVYCTFLKSNIPLKNIINQIKNVSVKEMNIYQ